VSNNKETTQIPGILRELTEFELFYKENYNKFYYYAHRFVDNDEVCRDIVSNAFEYAWQFYTHKKVDNWRNYIYSFLRNQCIDHLRHLSVHERYAELYIKMVHEAEEPEEIDERVLAIRNVLKELTPKTRLILEECYIDGKKYREVADDLEISESAVKKHIVQALRTIRQKIVKKPTSGVNDLDLDTSMDK
jgi:RNA polymerase sigma-70 factor (ECF subfamily)